MGSAYTTMAADAITRFQRLRGKRVTFVTGTDEHGEKIAEAAAKKGQEPQQHCDAIVAAFKGLWEEVIAPLMRLLSRPLGTSCLHVVLALALTGQEMLS